MQKVGIIRDYAIGGAFAAILHAEPISTIDLDIFFFFKEEQSGSILSLEKIYEFARQRGHSFDHEFINIDGWLIQFIEAGHNPLWAEAIETADKLDIEQRPVKVIDREHLVAMWLFAGRAKDYQKIAMFVDANILDGHKLRAVLERHNLLIKWEGEKWRFTSDDRG